MEQGGDGITVAVPGIRDLIAELKALNENVARRTVRKVIREAGEYILRRLKANAPVFTGKLRFNLDVVTKWKSRSGIMVAKVRVSTQGKAENPRNAFYWRFVEFGHRIGSRVKGRLVRLTRARTVTGRAVHAARARAGQLKGAASRGFIEGQEYVQKTQREIQQPVTSMFFRALEQAITRRQKRG
jgi:HK97 gp10 family phage protein